MQFAYRLFIQLQSPKILSSELIITYFFVLPPDFVISELIN